MRTAMAARKRTEGFTASMGDWDHAAYVLLDLVLMGVIATVVFYSRFSSGGALLLAGGRDLALPASFPLREYLGFFLLYAVFVILFLENQNLYHFPHSQSAAGESVTVGRAVLFASVLVAAVIYLSGIHSISRLIVGVNAVLNMAALASWRLWRRQVIERRVARGDALRNVLIVGAGPVGQKLARYFGENKQLGVLVKGFLDARPEGDSRVLGSVADLASLARVHFVDEIYITDHNDRDIVRFAATEASRNRIAVKIVPDLYDGLGWGGGIEHVGDVPVFSLQRQPIPLLGLWLKRLMDLVFSASTLLLLSPVLIAIALAIRFSSAGPVFYRAPRVGKKRRPFYCHKFRTMVANAETLKEELLDRNERDGGMFKIRDDPRVTPLGRFLRKYSLDELPQLWNVLKGEMSLVGPRPPSPDEVEKYEAEYLRRLEVTPGLTGLWQIHGRQDPSFARVLALDLDYIENWSIWLDLKILLETIPVVLRGTGS